MWLLRLALVLLAASTPLPLRDLTTLCSVPERTNTMSVVVLSAEIHAIARGKLGLRLRQRHELPVYIEQVVPGMLVDKHNLKNRKSELRHGDLILRCAPMQKTLVITDHF